MVKFIKNVDLSRNSSSSYSKAIDFTFFIKVFFRGLLLMEDFAIKM